MGTKNIWLVVSLPLKNIKSIVMIISSIWEKLKFSKPPTRLKLEHQVAIEMGGVIRVWTTNNAAIDRKLEDVTTKQWWLMANLSSTEIILTGKWEIILISTQ